MRAVPPGGKAAMGMPRVSTETISSREPRLSLEIKDSLVFEGEN
jgi:hypothetical protein